MAAVRLSLFAVLLVPAVGSAHPLPNMRYDRAVAVRLTPAAVAVLYTLDLSEWSMVLDGRTLVTPADVRDAPGATGFARVYAAKKAPFIADELRATLDGDGLTFRVEAADAEPDGDHLRVRFRFRADWPAGGPGGRFAFEDQTFDGRAGAVALTLDADGVELRDVAGPGALRGKSPLDLTPDEADRLRRVSAFVGWVESSRPTSSVPAPDAGLEDSTHPTKPKPSGNLAGLFDSGYGLGVLLLLAFGFGAAHAFTPGHGKTLVAAYLVGERGTVGHAVVLGLTTTLAHTGSVILVAAVLRFHYGDAIPAVAEAALKLAGGLLIFAVGVWLFLRRAGNRADHVHLFGGHHHHPGSGWVRVILLGLGGGLIPCWDAVLLLLVAASAGRLGAAVPLLLAFSAGLAAVLVGLGVGVVVAHRAGGRSFGDARWFRALPAISAAVLVGLGVWFARDGARTLLAP
jgi:nickel/cobalt exporter